MKQKWGMILSDKILEERGYFWWHEEPIPKGHFAPSSLVTGTLSINEIGKIHLELDGYLNGEHGPIATLIDRDRELPGDKAIQGKLKDSNKNVLLLGLRKHGGRFSSNGVSFEGFAATNCLVTRGAFPLSNDPLQFDALDVELTGMEDWLRLGNIETKRTRSRITARHRLPKSDMWQLDDGILTIRYDISGPFPSQYSRRSHELTLIECASINFSPKNMLPLTEMRTEYGRMQDLFILLTGSEYSLAWPRLKAGKDTFDLYFHGHGRSSKAPTWDDCWTNFVQLRERFGEIFSLWRRKHNDFGPGFYLYLGTRRGMKLYVEHRFVNLIWGIESLHRKKNGRSSMPTKLEQKIQRILLQIEGEDDREWLEGRLRNVSEPSLQQRLFEIFRHLPFDFDRKRLNRFCEECARCRNDISHFGGQRHEGDYQNFVIDVAKKSEAIGYLYHALLLQEIGIDSALLRQWIFDGPKSFAVKYTLREVGLLPEEAKDHSSM
ncbi:ApeA N-terminal domain 1-containing protein [Trinickia dabaoshanensis]|uniref:ApeA N-terminal domain 1-containing protein n=1 Tax=Trinickia dabaoshanensis TaxID=564714 RepID=UPI0011AFBAF3|nr:HEPN domain-containing protein [Trinickia dabaoshanensis]